jgi:hypothetical protein
MGGQGWSSKVLTKNYVSSFWGKQEEKMFGTIWEIKGGLLCS